MIIVAYIFTKACKNNESQHGSGVESKRTSGTITTIRWTQTSSILNTQRFIAYCNFKPSFKTTVYFPHTCSFFFPCLATASFHIRNVAVDIIWIYINICIKIQVGFEMGGNDESGNRVIYKIILSLKYASPKVSLMQ